MEFSIGFEQIAISLFGRQFHVSFSYIVGLCVTLLVLLACVIIRVFFIPRFKEIPNTFQMILEFIIETLDKFCISIMGHKGTGIAPWMFTVCVFILANGLIELFGVRTPLSDLAVTATLGLSTFVIINGYMFRKYGFIGRFKQLGKPIKFLAPIKMITDIAVPVSLSCRLFGNMLGGFIVMDLLYNALLSLTRDYWFTVLPVALAAVVPGILSLYFSLFHAAIQMYVFAMLSMSFIEEAIE